MKHMRILAIALSLCLLFAGLPATTETSALNDQPELWVSTDEEIEVAPEDADQDAPLWALEADGEEAAPALPEEGLLSNSTDEVIPDALPSNGSVPLDAEHFPDYSFRRFIREQYDTDGDGSLSEAEIAAVKVFNEKKAPLYIFYSLKGIEYLTALEKLDFWDTWELTELDLSKNTALKELELFGLELDKLDLSCNTALSKLTLNSCLFGELNLGQCAALTEVKLEVTTVPELDLSPAKSLSKLETVRNSIDRLNISGLTKLTELNLSYNDLQELTLGENPNLKVLLCPLNKLKRLDVRGCRQLSNLVNTVLPQSDITKYYPEATDLSVLLYIDESTGCRLMIDPDVLLSVSFIPVSSIQLDVTSKKLKVGKKKTLSATVLPKNATNPALDWSSSNPAVATVSAKGQITAKAPGYATITAAAKDGSGVKATCKVTVPSTIALNKTEASVKVGKKLTLKAKIKSTSGKDCDVKWTSSNETVATVNSAGKVTAKKPGKATITAKLKDGSDASDKCKITVPSVVKLNKTKATLKVGKKLQLEATVQSASGKDPGVRWKSDNPDVAKVNSSNGKITAVSCGEAIITATAKDGSGGSKSCKITVTSTTKVKLTRSKMQLAKDKTVSLSATVTTESGKPCAVKWSSSNNKIVSVTTKGLITAKKVGKATITATARDGSGASDSCVVEVPEPSFTSVAMNMNNIQVRAGRNISLGADVVSTKSAFPEVAWSSSNTKVAKVSSVFGHTCTVSTLKPGTAIITVKAKDGSGALDTCEVIVVDDTVTTLTLSDDHLTIRSGDEERVAALLERGDGTSSFSDIAWSSSDTKVATVKDGWIKAKRVGNAKITAKAKDGSGLTAVCWVTVVPMPVSDIELSELRYVLRQDESFTLKATVSPANAANKRVEWTSSDTTIATVNSSGVVSAKPKAGTALITATAKDGSGVSASCEVVVIGPIYRALLIGEVAFDPVCYQNQYDVENMYNMLRSVYGPTDYSYLEPVKMFNLTRQEILDAISATFADAGKDDVSLFFIASHGDDEREGFEAGMIETRNEQGENGGGLSLSALAETLRAVPGKVIVILQTCGSGAAIYANGRDNIRDSIINYDNAVIRAFAKADPGLDIDGDIPNSGEFRVANKFYVLTSSAYQETSHGRIDSTVEKSYNYFTKWLIEGVGTRGNRPADQKYGGNKDGIVDLYELYSYISKVGDSKIIIGDDYLPHHQHVQVYPANTRFELFK